LGLAIVYGILQRHSASIDIESEVGKGTTFVIRLPIHTGQHAPPQRAEAKIPLRPLHVLVVDDDPLLRDIEAEYLSSDGHTVETASNGNEALQKLRWRQFDLLMTDRAMPQMNGDQLAAAVKQFAPNIPVILVTGFADMMKSNDNKPAGVDLIMPKPFTQANLRDAVLTVTEPSRN
jgi:CheY-like chemotaxis protein